MQRFRKYFANRQINKLTQQDKKFSTAGDKTQTNPNPRLNVPFTGRWSETRQVGHVALKASIINVSILTGRLYMSPIIWGHITNLCWSPFCSHFIYTNVWKVWAVGSHTLSVCVFVTLAQTRRQTKSEGRQSTCQLLAKEEKWIRCRAWDL